VGVVAVGTTDAEQRLEVVALRQSVESVLGVEADRKAPVDP
jgi:hypothetical protein